MSALSIPVLFALGACARMGAPTGGPPDNVPPVVVLTEPDTFAVVEPFDGPVVIRLNERISERPRQGPVQEAVTVSPTTGAVEVDFQRSAIEVSMEGGFQAGRVYRVRLEPVVVDMFSNPMVTPFELVFSTGPDFSPGVVGGLILDRITGDPVSDGRVHAVPSGEPEREPYLSRTDEDGVFVLRYLPTDRYRVTAFQDRNGNRALDPVEARDSRMVTLEGPADTLFVSMEVLAPDTTPARIVDAAALDSVAIRIEVDDFLDPAVSLEAVEVTISREDGPAPTVAELLHQYEWEARRLRLEARRAAAADSATAAPADSARTPARPVPAPDTIAGPPPRSERDLYALLESALEAGVEYAVEVSGIVNIAGTGGGGGTGRVVWEPPPPDTTAAAADSLAAPQDTTGTGQ